MIRDTEYMNIVSEVYDLSDYKTKKAVLFCNEAQKSANIEHIVGKLYVHIKDNTDQIDFGSIPKSKGILTNVENYQQIVDCINTIKDLLVEYHENTDLIDQLNEAFVNIQNRERIFTKAFALNIDFPMMIYNTTVLSVISGLSVMISSSIEYIKNGHDSFDASFNKTRYAKSKDHVLYQYVRDFNRVCKSGQLDKLMQDAIRKNIVKESFNYKGSNQNINIINEDSSEIAGFVALIIGIGASIYAFLKLVSYVIYYFMYTRMALSEWFAVQARFLEINAENLKNRDDPKGEDHKKKSYQNQIKLVQIFNKVSNALALKDSKAKREADEEQKQEERRRYEEDDRDNDSSNNDGGLF